MPKTTPRAVREYTSRGKNTPPPAAPMPDFARLLDVLGIGPEERVSVCHKLPTDTDLTATVGTALDAPARARPYAERADLWFGVCPLRPDVALSPGARGSSAQVARIPALWADLDAKPYPAGMGSTDKCLDVAVELSKILGRPPAAVVESGSGGLHPYWKLRPYPDADHPRAVQVLKRWGVLVKAVAQEAGGAADSVFDPARVLRIPGSRNQKPGGGPATVMFPADDSGAEVEELDLDDAEELLDRAGISELPESELGELVPAGAWPLAVATCHYVTATVTGWAQDTPRGGRHQWLMKQAVRLMAHARYGCLTATDLAAAPVALGKAFAAICKAGADPRAVKPLEVAGALVWARGHVETMTPARLLEELHGHTHDRPKPPPGPTEHNTDTSTGEVWEEPEPLGVVAHPGPLPLDALPEYLRTMVEAVAVQSQAPREVVLAAALGTLAAATRGAWDVRVHDGWKAGPTCLWTLALAGSGERKDAGVDPLLDPLRTAERALVADAIKANGARALERERIEGLLKEAEAARDAGEMERLRAAEYEHRARPVPTFLVSDPTPEALGLSMSESGGAACITGTEAASLQTVAGRYSDKGGGNFSLVNHAYDGQGFSDLRIRRDPIRVDRPALTWCVAVQPEVVAGYATSQSEGSGFLARFVLLAAERLVGHRDMRARPVSPVVAARWANVVERLHGAGWERYSAMCRGIPEEPIGPAACLTFEPEAREMLVSYAERLEAQKLDPGSPLAALGGWIEKHPARIGRIAAILALADDPARWTVPGPYVAQALTLAEPLVQHATASLAVLRHAAREEPTERVAEILRRLGKPEVSTREVWLRARKQTSWCGGAQDVRAALTELVELKWLRGPVAVPTGGAPSERWHVHPSLTEPAPTHTPAPGRKTQ